MTLAEARASLRRTVQADMEPILSDGDLDAILANHLRYSTYTASTAYVVGNRVRLSNGRIYRCAVAGTSAETGLGPEWPDSLWATTGQTFADGTGDLLWQDDGPDHIGNYDLGGAERDCWLIKASKVASNIDYSNQGMSAKASQEAESYRKRANLCSATWVF